MSGAQTSETMNLEPNPTSVPRFRDIREVVIRLKSIKYAEDCVWACSCGGRWLFARSGER